MTMNLLISLVAISAAGAMLPIDAFALLCTAAALLVAYASIVTVPRGQRIILRSNLFGSIRVIDAGLSWRNPFTEIPVQGPWQGLGVNHTTTPAPGSRVVLDPQPSQLHTKEGVPGSVDVTVECRVVAWGEDVMTRTVPFMENGKRRINRWLSQRLDGLAADDFSYGSLTILLNEPASLASLNAEMAPYRLQAEAVHIDPNGVALDPKYVKQRQEINIALQKLEAERKKLRREAEVADGRRTNERRQLEFKLQQERLSHEARYQRETAAAQHALETSRLQTQAAAQRSQVDATAVAQLLEAGLSPSEAAAFKIAQLGAAAVGSSGAGTKLLAVSPGMLGLHGLQGLSALVGSASGGGVTSGAAAEPFVTVGPAGASA